MKLFVSVLMTVVLVTSLLSAVPIGAVAAETAPALNIGFEDGTTSGFTGNVEEMKLAVTSEAVHSGSKSLLVSGRKDSWHKPCVRVEKYFTPDYKYYEVTAWVLSKSNDDNGFYIDSDGSVHVEFYGNSWKDGVSKSDGWTKLSGQFALDATNPIVELTMRVGCTGSDTEYYIDDISIKPMDMEPIYASARLPSLCEIYKDYFLFGATFPVDSPFKYPIVQRHFNVITMYLLPNQIIPVKGVYDFTAKDEEVKVYKNTWPFIFVNPLTDSNASGNGWLTVNPDGAPLTRSEAIRNLTEYVNNVTTHFAGQIYEWGVVNEAMTWNGNVDGAGEAPSNWREALFKEDGEKTWYRSFSNGADESKGESGADYIEMAFRLARQADPNAILCYNDFYLEIYPNKAKAVADMVKEINDNWLAEGNDRLLIEVVGSQTHNDEDWLTINPADVETAIKQFIDIGVKINISEIGIRLYGEEGNTGTLTPTPEMYDKQAKTYAELFQIFKKYSEHINRVTSLGLDDYNDNNDGLYQYFFDSDYNPKLAYFAVADPEGYLAGNFDTAEKREKWIRENSIAPNLDTASSWAQNGITNAVQKGYVPENVQDNYKSVITRAEFCRMAMKWLEYKTGKSIDAILAENDVSRDQNAFSDTTDSDILAAYALGITSGSGNGLFSPNGQFTREQAATMIRNTCKAAGMDISDIAPSGFEDMNSASSWAADSIDFCCAGGIMTGTSAKPKLFSPKTTYTREQSIITFSNIK